VVKVYLKHCGGTNSRGCCRWSRGARSEATVRHRDGVAISCSDGSQTVSVRLREGKAPRSKKGKRLGSGLCYEQRGSRKQCGVQTRCKNLETNETAVATQWLRDKRMAVSEQQLDKHVPAETNIHAIDLLLETGCFLCGLCEAVIKKIVCWALQGRLRRDCAIVIWELKVRLWKEDFVCARQRGCYIRTITAGILLEKKLWSWASRGLEPRWTDWR
jgi:hypothetical protein